MLSTFGIFTRVVPLDNVAEFRLDDLPPLTRLGGARIHFMIVRKRYRASFNSLEDPRIVIPLKRRKGLVRDVSFSTRRPDEVLQRLRETVAAHSGGYASSARGRCMPSDRLSGVLAGD